MSTTHATVWRRRLLVIGLATGGMFAFAHHGAVASTHETVVIRDGDSVTITAGAGVANRVTIDVVGDELVVRDAATDLVAGGGCTLEDATQARCSLAGVTEVRLSLGDLNDVVAKPRPLPAPVNYEGGDGDDTFVAANTPDGVDRYGGGPGRDAVSYGQRTVDVSVSIDDVADDGSAGEGDDVRSDVEVLFSGAGDDVLIGSDQSNGLTGGAGNDVVEGRGGVDAIVDHAGDDVYAGGAGDDLFSTTAGPDGADDYSGGDGVDTMSYATRSQPVAVTIDGQPDDGFAGEADNVRADIENVAGSEAGDTLVGSTVANRLVGGGGDDHLDGRSGPDREEGGDGDDSFDQGPAANGGDVLVGGEGRDTVVYTARTNPVTGDADGVADDGEAGESDNIGADVETILLPGGTSPAECPGFEGDPRNHVVGTDGDETLTGTDGDDIICGLGGSDTLEGGAGDDTLIGGPGAVDFVFGEDGDDLLVNEAEPDGPDLLSGGPGIDEVTYAARTTPVTVTIPERGTTLPGDDGAPGEGDGVSATVERVTGGAGADILSAEPCECAPVGRGLVLNGGPGNDRLTGGARFDALRGDDGHDILVALAQADGSDVFDGGDGFDTVSYAARSTAVHVTVGDAGGTADDGSPGEGDEVTDTVEAVIGGGGDDELTLGGFLFEPDRRGILDGRGGDDTLISAAGPDELFGGAGDDLLVPGRFQNFPTDGADVFHGGPGIDAVSYAGYPVGVTVTIDGVANDGRSGTNEGDNVGVDVEQVLGTPARDVLFGSSSDNLLVGGGGDDFLAGRGGDDLVTGNDGDDFIDAGATPDGDDQYFGGAGTDTISYRNRLNAVTVDLTGFFRGEDRVFADVDVVIGGHGGDFLRGSDGDDRIEGGPGDDTISGWDGDDQVFGQNGDDALDVGETALGADAISGGPGRDRVSYLGHRTGVTVTVDGIADDGSPGEGDNVATDVEDVAGSFHDDVLVGGPGPNTIRGRSGDDDLSGGAGNDVFVMESFADGRDAVRGGDGIDIADYSLRTDPVDVRLGNFDQRGEDILGPADDVEGAIGGSGDDQLLDFRTPAPSMPGARLFGEAGDDTISGVDIGGLNDRLEGGPGDDNIRGLQGRDTILGGTGNDTLYGGSVNGGFDDDPDLVLGGGGNDFVRGDGGNDTLRGGSGNDSLSGDTGDDTLRGEAGDDLLLGQAGDDVLLGGPGFDHLFGGDGVDECHRGSGGGELFSCEAGA